MRNRKFIFKIIAYTILYLISIVTYNYFTINNLLFQNGAKVSLIYFYNYILSKEAFIFSDFTLKLIILCFNWSVVLAILLLLLNKILDTYNKKIIEIIIYIHLFILIYVFIWFIR